MYVHHSPIFMSVERLFPINAPLNREVIQRSVARSKKWNDTKQNEAIDSLSTLKKRNHAITKHYY